MSLPSRHTFTPGCLALLIICQLLAITPTFSSEATDNANHQHAHCEITPETNHHWYDLSHAYISKKFCEPAVSFDNFFGDDRNLENELSGTYARWRNDIIWNESDRLTFKTELRAKFKLPKINKRLKLIITSNIDDSFENPLATGVRNPGQNEQEPLEKNEISDSTIGLRYDIKSRPSYNTSFRIGIKTQLPLQLHSSFRYRYSLPFGNDNLFRFTETLHWRKWEGFGKTSRFDLEKLFTPVTLGRASISGTFSEISQGIDWHTNLGTFHKLSKRAGLSFDIVSAGITRPNTVIETYGFITKYRRNFYRDWLFFEVIPEINWRRNDNGNYEAVNTLILRIDVQFWQD